MLELQRDTYRFFIKPLSKTRHIVKSIKRRFTSFLSKIRASHKEILRHVLRKIEHDCRSTTGNNIRKLQLTESDNSDSPYVPIPEVDIWKVTFAEELIKIKTGSLIVEGITQDELQDITKSICCA